MNDKPETRNLPVKLTRDELDQKRDRLANLLRDADIVESEKKLANKKFADRMKNFKDQIYQVAQEVRSRTEYRDVEIYRQKNYSLNVEEIIRADTHEVVGSRPLKPNERQMEIHEVTDTAMGRDAKSELAAARRRRKKNLDKEAEEAAAQAAAEAEATEEGKLAHLRDVVKKTQEEIRDEDNAEAAE